MLSERKKGIPAKVWDAVKNWPWIGGGSRSSRESRQQFRPYNNGQEPPVTIRTSSNTRRERDTTAGSTSQAPRRVDYEWRDTGEIGKWATVTEGLEERVAKLERLLQEKTAKLTTDELVQGKMVEGNATGSSRSSRKASDVGFLTGKVVELNPLLQDKPDQLSHVEHGEIAREKEIIIRLEAEVAQLNRLLREKMAENFSAECAVNEQIEKQKREIGRLKAEVAQSDRLLREKMAESFSAERAVNEIEKQKREIGRLKAEVAQSDRLLREKMAESFSAERAANEIEKQKREIGRLKAEVAQSDRLLRERMAENFSAERAANEQISKQKREIGRLEAEVVRLNHFQEQTSSAEDAENGQEAIYLSTSGQKQHEEENTEMGPRHSSTGNEQTIKLPSSTIVRQVNTLSVADVADLVRALHSQIEQASGRIMDSLPYRETPISSEELQDVLNELNDYIGPWLCNDLRSKSDEFNMEPDSLITQLTLQTGLLNACSYIINYGVPPADGVTLSRIHGNMAETGQAVADTWKALARTDTTTSQSESWEVNRKYLAGITFKLITALGGSLESGGALPPQHNEEIEDIVKKALELHRKVSRDMVSMELITYTIPCDVEFDPSRMVMEDTERGGDETTQDTVICTLEMGLQCRKRKESGSGEEWGVTMKAKVVLASTLEA